MSNLPPSLPPHGQAPPLAAPPPGAVYPMPVQPIGYAGPMAPPPGPPVDPRAKMLVNWSTALGWGGLALLFLGSAAAGIAFHSPVAAGIVGGIGMLSAIIGAILGQIGRAMQGRVV